MKDLKDKILLIFAALLVGLGIVVFFLMKEVKKANDKAERWEQNYFEPGRQVMTPAEFKEFLSKRDKNLIDSLNKIIADNIKVKNITEYHTITNNYVDTTIVSVPTTDEQGDGMYPISYMDSKECWGIEGYFYEPGKLFAIEKRMANDSIYAVEYFTRKKIIWLPIGKKEYHRQLWSTCKGKLSETKIEIKRKPE